jgi:hypothetical protein
MGAVVVSQTKRAAVILINFQQSYNDNLLFYHTTHSHLGANNSSLQLEELHVKNALPARDQEF